MTWNEKGLIKHLHADIPQEALPPHFLLLMPLILLCLRMPTLQSMQVYTVTCRLNKKDVFVALKHSKRKSDFSEAQLLPPITQPLLSSEVTGAGERLSHILNLIAQWCACWETNIGPQQFCSSQPEISQASCWELNTDDILSLVCSLRRSVPANEVFFVHQTSPD